MTESTDDQPDLHGLGTFIRERRASLHLTQTQLAERLGWTQERISVLENAKYGVPSLQALIRLAEALEVPLDALIEAAGYARMRRSLSAPGAATTDFTVWYTLHGSTCSCAAFLERGETAIFETWRPWHATSVSSIGW
jgi:transcriptional regulator with XRE-family HTH domain